MDAISWLPVAGKLTVVLITSAAAPPSTLPRLPQVRMVVPPAPGATVGLGPTRLRRR